MTEEAPSVSIADYKNTFKYPAREDSLSKAITSAKLLAINDEEEMQIFEAIQNPQSPQTEKIWSLQDANTQKDRIYASLIIQIAAAKDLSDLRDNQFFRQQITNPLDRWNNMLNVSDIKEIHNVRKNTEEVITGLLWTLYKPEIKGYDNETDFAKSFFSPRDYEIRPQTFNEERLSEIKSQVSNQ